MSATASVLRLKSIALLSILACMLLISSCYRYHVYQIRDAEGRQVGNQPGTEWRHKTLNAFFWGKLRQDLAVDNCHTGDGRGFGIEEVRVDTNFAYALASVLSLGIWVPLDVSWRCAKPPVPTGTLR